MKFVITLFLIQLILLSKHPVNAQTVQPELLAGHRSLFYQHLVISKSRPEARWSFIHMANINFRYNRDVNKEGRPNEVMNQVFLAYRLNRYFIVMTGAFYSNATDIRPSVAMQFATSFKNGLVLLQPRIDVQAKGSFEWMGLVEYRPIIAAGLKLYARVQWMNNIGPYHHNRSYQRLRIGVDRKSWQTGIGSHFDEYGKTGKVYVNLGLFIRKEFR